MEREQEDVILLSKMRNGDPKAFDSIFIKYYTSLLTFCCSLGLQQEQAEDCVADLFTDLWSARDKIQIRSTLKAYLFGAARNKTNLLYRQKKIECISDTDAALSVIDQQPQPDELLTQKDRLDWLNSVVSRLPEQTKTVFLLRWQHQLSDNEVADLLHKSRHTVRTLLYRAVLFVHDQWKKVK
ncbi:RNA polymerase sigma factor (sigma-70 family) [Sphingobacterium allocomposti]|uniref:RNA polymerase sigma factor (Sigma-70 family) n=1 Tax=Sphingobacterium allocomposti TaxID=415956 RepID=A0A5S5DLT4_9SPHI|nr:sigma-70 family RNA polymerase sigma factor [Sphingobacterium composti Yoo et al. 2007 non Ten et al. 2007]TYP96338.1 RNA polymerase sigma factor (sigma-70 family) [Sphingobacterium composti Yoo et al. 2007 non Ten et al. 2007]